MICATLLAALFATSALGTLLLILFVATVAALILLKPARRRQDQALLDALPGEAVHNVPSALMPANAAAACARRAGQVTIVWDEATRHLLVSAPQRAPLRLELTPQPQDQTSGASTHAQVTLSCHAIHSELPLEDALQLLPEGPDGCSLLHQDAQAMRLLSLDSSPRRMTLRLAIPAHLGAGSIGRVAHALCAWLDGLAWPERREAVLAGWTLRDTLPIHTRYQSARLFFEWAQPQDPAFERMWQWMREGDARRAALVLPTHEATLLGDLDDREEVWAWAIDALLIARDDLVKVALSQPATPRWAQEVGRRAPDALLRGEGLRAAQHRVVLYAVSRMAPERLAAQLRQPLDAEVWVHLLTRLPTPWPAPVSQAITEELPAALLDGELLDAELRLTLVRSALTDAPTALISRLETTERWSRALESVSPEQLPDTSLHLITAHAPDMSAPGWSALALRALLSARMICVQRAHDAAPAPEHAAQLSAEIDAALAHPDVRLDFALSIIAQAQVPLALDWLTEQSQPSLDTSRRMLETARALCARADEETRVRLERWALDALRRAVKQHANASASAASSAAAHLIRQVASTASLRELGEIQASLDGVPGTFQTQTVLKQTIKALQEQLGGASIGGLTLSAGGEGGQLSLAQAQAGELTIQAPDDPSG